MEHEGKAGKHFLFRPCDEAREWQQFSLAAPVHLIKEEPHLVDWRRMLQVLEKKRDCVLATLIGVKGSSYRRVGARLLLAPDGETVGSISGGCLESDLQRRAKWLIQKGSGVEHYSTSFDDTEEIPFGLGCGGELDVLLEPADGAEGRALFAGVRAVLAGETLTVTTFLPGGGRGLRRAVFQRHAPGTEGTPTRRFASEGLTERELSRAAGMDGAADPEAAQGEGEGEVFAEVLRPPQRLLVLGAGEDARPMVAMAAMLGWHVELADGRRQMTKAERFPGAQRVYALEGGEVPEVRPEDAVVLMTHSYEQDRELLAAVVPAGARYLGLLGARHRSSLLVSEVALRLGWTVAQCCERLYAPVGMDLGGDGAEAIALAVIAEIQACVQGKLGSRRRLTAEDVAEGVAQAGAAQYLKAQCALATQ